MSTNASAGDHASFRNFVVVLSVCIRKVWAMLLFFPGEICGGGNMVNLLNGRGVVIVEFA